MKKDEIYKVMTDEELEKIAKEDPVEFRKIMLDKMRMFDNVINRFNKVQDIIDININSGRLIKSGKINICTPADGVIINMRKKTKKEKTEDLFVGKN